MPVDGRLKRKRKYTKQMDIKKMLKTTKNIPKLAKTIKKKERSI